MVSARLSSFYTVPNEPENSGRDWVSVSRHSPCPICGKGDWCRVSSDGTTAWCGRLDHAPGGWRFIKRGKTSGHIFKADNGLAEVFRPAPQTSKPKKVPKTAEEWQKIADAHQRHIGDRLDVLAADLGLPVAALRSIGAGWDSVGGRWTFPERDGAGGIIGMGTRTPAGEKKCYGGSRRGLTYDPAGWSRGMGPILLVEGPSDTAAATAMGMAVVGRPSNSGGVEHLAQLLAAVPYRKVIVVGENDLKANGDWPGRKGAESTARRLAETMERTIFWSMVPDGVKDTREYLRRHGADAGGYLVDRLELTAEVIDGGRPCGVEVPPGVIVEPIPERGPARDVEGYREETRATFDRIIEAGRPGIFLHRGEVGSGKTTALIEAVAAIPEESRPTVVMILPTHANVTEKAAEWQAAGVPAAALPKLSAHNCQNLDAVNEAQRWGMVAGAAVCGTCQFRTQCKTNGYMGQKREAMQAAAIVTTHAMAAMSPEVFRGRDLIAFDEQSRDALATVYAADVGRDFLTVRYLLENVPNRPPFAVALLAVIERIQAAAIGMEAAGVVEVAPPDPVEPPKNWQKVFYQWVRRFGHTLDAKDLDGIGPVVQLLAAAATGAIDGKLWVEASERHHGGALYRRAIGKRINPIPEGKTVFLLDADGNADHLRALSGRDVEDVTPAGGLEFFWPVVQVPGGPNRGQRTNATAAAIDSMLIRRPEVRRLGVIGHKKHIDAIQGERGYMTPPCRERVARWCGFGTGPDRADNTWTDDCDALQVIGLHRPPEIREWLIVHGYTAAAAEDGKFETIYWEGVTTDGRRAVFEGKTFRHPVWRMAADAVWLAGIRQAIGRARAALPKGIPVEVWCDLPLGLPVDAGVEPEGTPEMIRQTVAVVWETAMLHGVETAGGERSALPPIGYLDGSALPAPIVPTSTAIEVLRQCERIGGRQAQKLIRAAIDAGRLERLPGRLLRVVEDAPTEKRPPKSPAPGRSAVWPTTDTPEKLTPPGANAEAAGADSIDVEEAAAIMEIDGCLDRETAIRRARIATHRPRDNPAAPVVETRSADWRPSPRWPLDSTVPMPPSAAHRAERPAAVPFLAIPTTATVVGAGSG